MILMEKINEIWAAITPRAGTPIARRADPLHPLDFFVGYDENQNMYCPNPVSRSVCVQTRGVTGNMRFALC